MDKRNQESYQLGHWVKYEPLNANKHTSSACVVIKNYLFTFGSPTYQNDVYVLDLEQQKWHHTQPLGDAPVGRNFHSACLVEDNKIIFFGGYNGKVLNDTSILAIQDRNQEAFSNNSINKIPITLEWVPINPSGNPPYRYGHTSHIHQDYMYTFGGIDEKRNANNGVYRLNLNKCFWEYCNASGQKPPNRSFHCSGMESGAIYVFGGKDGGYFNDMYVLDLYVMKWQYVIPGGTVPSARAGASLIKKNSNFFLFAGHGNSHLNDMYAYYIKGNQWVKFEIKGTLPEPRSEHSAVCYKTNLLVFGGIGCNNGSTIYSIDINIDPFKERVQSNPFSYIKDFKNLFDDKIFTDITFVVQGEEISAHKVILATRSSYFQRLFTSNMMECYTNKIPVLDMTAQTFKALIQYIYCNEVDLDENLSRELLVVAEKYILRDLKILCENFILQHITDENVIDLLATADKYEAYKIKDACFKFIIKNLTKLNEGTDLNRLSKDLILELIEYGCLKESDLKGI